MIIGDAMSLELLLAQEKDDLFEMLDRWLAPAHRYFKVSGEDGIICILRQDVDSGRWQLIPFGRSDQAPSIDASSRLTCCVHL